MNQKSFGGKFHAPRMLLALLVALLMFSCQREELEVSTQPLDLQAGTASDYGYCEDCELPNYMSGSLSSVLMFNNDFLNVMRHCYNETPALVCRSGVGNLQSQTTSNSVTVYLAGAQWGGNDQADHCSFLYQLGGWVQAARPSGNYLLKEITSITHLGSSNFRVYMTWQKYICGENGDPQLPGGN